MKRILRIILIILLISFWTLLVNAQRLDTIKLSNDRNYLNWRNQRQKILVESIEAENDGERYQMIYVNKYVIDKRNHKIYIFSSYDLNFGDESGIGLEFIIPNKKRKYTNNKKHK